MSCFLIVSYIQPPRPPLEEDDLLLPPLDRVLPLELVLPLDDRLAPELLLGAELLAGAALLVGVDRLGAGLAARERAGVADRVAVPELLLVPLLERTAERVVRVGAGLAVALEEERAGAVPL